MLKIFYKLAHDVLALSLVAFSGFLVAEVVLPGFLTRFVTLTELIFGIALVLGSIVFLRWRLQVSGDLSEENAVSLTNVKLSRLQIFLVLFFSTLLLLPVLRSFAWYEIVVVLGGCIGAGYLLLKNLEK